MNVLESHEAEVGAIWYHVWPYMGRGRNHMQGKEASGFGKHVARMLEKIKEVEGIEQ